MKETITAEYLKQLTIEAQSKLEKSGMKDISDKFDNDIDCCTKDVIVQMEQTMITAAKKGSNTYTWFVESCIYNIIRKEYSGQDIFKFLSYVVEKVAKYWRDRGFEVDDDCPHLYLKIKW